MPNGTYLSISVKRKSEQHPLGAFFASVYIDGRYKCSKEASIAVLGEDVAHETIELWSQDRIKEFGLKKIVMPTVDELLQRIKKNSGEKCSTGPKLTNAKKAPLIKVFSTVTIAKANIKAAFHAYGYDRCKSVLDIMMETLEHCYKTEQAQQDKVNDAKAKLAQSMFDIYKESGMDMAASIKDPEVKDLYRRLMADED